MRYCGNCGAPLSAGDLVEGICARCGARVSPTGDVIAPYNSVPAESFGGMSAPYPYDRTPVESFGGMHTNPTGPGAALNSGMYDASPPLWTAARPAQARVPQGNSPLAIILGGAVAFFLVVGIVLAVVLHHDATTTPVGGNGGTSTGPGSSTNLGGLTPTAQPVHHKTPTPLIQLTATPNTTPTPGATNTPAPMDTPTPTVVPSPTPIPPPTIDANPNPVLVLRAACLLAPGASGSFTLSNGGGGQMMWTATVDGGAPYKVSPTNGTLNGGDGYSVTISNVHGNGSIHIDAPGATNSGLQVIVTCSNNP